MSRFEKTVSPLSFNDGVHCHLDGSDGVGAPSVAVMEFSKGLDKSILRDKRLAFASMRDLVVQESLLRIVRMSSRSWTASGWFHSLEEGETSGRSCRMESRSPHLTSSIWTSRLSFAMIQAVILPSTNMTTPQMSARIPQSIGTRPNQGLLSLRTTG